VNIQQFKNAPVSDPFARDQSTFIAGALKNAPGSFHRHIESRFNYLIKSGSLAAANLDLLQLSETLKQTSTKLVQSDDEICDTAERRARECGRSIAGGGIFAGRAYARAYGAKELECTEAGEIARLSDSLWWRKQLRVKHGREVERIALLLNIVNRKAEIYASNSSVSRRRSQKTRNRKMLEEVIAVNESGKEYTLAELSALGVSNPDIRRGELMTRISGFEMYAQKHSHVGVFWTITAPSKMHSSLSKTGQRNPKYDGTTPKQAQAYLSKTWARVRASFKRKGIEVYGMRVAEPQHDGTPHWHMLVFIPPEQVEKATRIYKSYALEEDGNEKGAQKYRFDSKLIDWKKGTAAGYIAKYIAKNIDAYGVGCDLYGKDANQSVERVDAWASTWGIRQFQQVGGASVTVWRELRRLSAEGAKGSAIEKHFNAADVGDWFAYLEQMKKAPVSLLKVWSDKPGRYVEPVGDITKGLILDGQEFITKIHEWSIKHGVQKAESFEAEKINSSDPGGAENMANDPDINFREDGVFSPPWSSVNKCTLKIYSDDKEKFYPDPRLTHCHHVRAYYLRIRH